VAQDLVGLLLRSRVERSSTTSGSTSQRERDGKNAGRSADFNFAEISDCASTGSATVTTIRSQLSSSVELRSFVLAGLAGLGEGAVTEGYELDRKTEKQVPKAMIGRRLSQEEAKRLLAEFE
jgi:hypothetical protein